LIGFPSVFLSSLHDTNDATASIDRIIFFIWLFV
jgi:hypothetical protein